MSTTPHLPPLLGQGRRAITSVCSAHPLVIEAALRLGLTHDAPVLIEATCNQVNHHGGYTGMSPQGFKDFVHDIARKTGFPVERLVLGGDHLGPNPWRHLPSDTAMDEAALMVAAYAKAGFRKLHLDCSMGCAGEPEALDDATIATRAARLAQIAEAHAVLPPLYVIGTEVPVPGGARAALHADPTRPEAVRHTYAVHRDVFESKGLGAAFARVLALVVQPGVEFGDAQVISYDPTLAQPLLGALPQLEGRAFEAHSTDYQTEAALHALARDGFAILKVGPWLTFALREALYGLDAIADVLEAKPPAQGLMRQMEAVLLAEPAQWQPYYHGPQNHRFLQRHFSYSDRIRYYWPHPDAQTAVNGLLQRLGNQPIPQPLIEQYLGRDMPATDAMTARDILIHAVQRVLRIYDRACLA